MIELLILKVALCGFGAALLVASLATAYNVGSVTGYIKGVGIALLMMIGGVIIPM